MASRLEPHYELRNFLRKNITDINSTVHTGANINWIFGDEPSGEQISTDIYPRILIKQIARDKKPLGLRDTTTFGNVTLQIDITCSKDTGILTITSTSESIGTISNSPRLNFDHIPNSVTNIKHDGTSFGTVTAVRNDDSFTSPASLAAGTVQYSRETGNLNFSSADLTSYSGQTITSTYVLSLDSEMAVKYLANEIERDIFDLWYTDTSIGGLLDPEIISSQILPFRIDARISRYMIEIKFKEFDMGRED